MREMSVSNLSFQLSMPFDGLILIHKEARTTSCLFNKHGVIALRFWKPWWGTHLLLMLGNYVSFRRIGKLNIYMGSFAFQVAIVPFLETRGMGYLLVFECIWGHCFRSMYPTSKYLLIVRYLHIIWLYLKSISFLLSGTNLYRWSMYYKTGKGCSNLGAIAWLTFFTEM